MKADNRYISFLDGFRGYAILFVVISHLYLTKMSVAYLGVTLFFYVSGLLITKLLIFEYNKHNKISLKDFYLRRFFRLYPALTFMIIVSCIITLLYGYNIILKDILAGFFYFTNYYLVYFNPQLPDHNYLLISKILWSLSVEEHYYFFFPVLFLLLYRKNNRTLFYVLTILLFVFPGIRIATYLSLNDGQKIFEVTYYTTHCRADSILYGCFSALLLYSQNAKWYLKILRSYFAIIAGLILLIFSLAYSNLFFQTTLKYSIQGIAFCLIIPAFSFLEEKQLFYKLVDNKITVFIGKLSYSLYLFHWVSLKIGNLNFPIKSFAWYSFVILATVIFSLTSYYLIEKPFLALRKRFGSNISVKSRSVFPVLAEEKLLRQP